MSDTISVPRQTLINLRWSLVQALDDTPCFYCEGERSSQSRNVPVEERHRHHDETCTGLLTLATYEALLASPPEPAWPLDLTFQQIDMLNDVLEVVCDTDTLPFHFACPCDPESEAFEYGHLDHCPLTVLQRKLGAAYRQAKAQEGGER